MDFHGLARRDLQALCKLNKIPANITNVAMADALKSLEIVEGIEEFLNRSPERNTVTAAKVPRTGRRTCTRSKPIGDESESVQPMTKSTRRRAISDEIMEESKTPAVRSSRKAMEPTTGSEESENLDKRDVANTPAVATYSRRNQSTRRTNVKGVSTVQRVYSTRRSTRLTEKNDVESIPTEEKEEKFDSLAAELSKIDLADVSDKKSMSGNDAEIVLQESVEKSDVVALEIVSKLKYNEALDELNAVQEDNTNSLMIENEDNKGYPMDTENPHEQTESDEAALESGMENPHEQTKSDEATLESGMELKQDDVQENIVEELKESDETALESGMEWKQDDVQENIVEELKESDETVLESGMESKQDDGQENIVEELKEVAEQLFNTLDESHFVHEVNDNNLVIVNEDNNVEKSLESNDPKENADQTEVNSIACFISSIGNGDEMDSEKSEVELSIGDSELLQHMTCSEVSKADEIPNNNYPQEIVSTGGVENKPVAKMAIKGLDSVSDDKENIDRSGMKFELTKEAKKDKKETDELNAKSLRELTKMLKEKLNISNNTAEEIGKVTVTKARPALQKLKDNCQR